MNFFLVLLALLTGPILDDDPIRLQLIDNTEVHGTLVETDSQGYLVEVGRWQSSPREFCCGKGNPEGHRASGTKIDKRTAKKS